MRFRSILLSLALLAPSTAWAQGGVDVSGTWTLQAEITASVPTAPGEGVTPCIFTGGAEVDQDGAGNFTGTASLNLNSGPQECPQQVSADVSGAVDGTSISGMLAGGNLGDAFFDGSVVAEQLSMSGTVDVETGPFGGSSGIWNGQLGGSALGIPTLGAVGLLLLAVLLAAMAWMVLARRKAA